MKLIPLKYVSLLGLASLLCGLLQSCATSWENPPEVPDEQSEIMLRTQLMDGIVVNGLLTKLYVFSKVGTGDYLLTDSLPQVVSGTSRLKLSLADLKTNDYRFLFIATPEANPEITVRRKNNYALLPDAAWQDITIGATVESLSIDNYYGIKDMTGSEILEDKEITAVLTRLVGQMVFCFYKVGLGGLKDPVAVDDPNVASVMDRVSSIDLTYRGVPRLITFDAGNNPVAVDGLESTVSRSVRFTLTEDGQKVVLPQEDISVETADSIPGGAILKEACMLPSQEKVHVSMVFHYYDTTPICENFEKGHVHSASCYSEETISLQLPQSENSPGLSVLPDCFTINNAGLPCNRVIDIEHTSGFDVDTKWN